MKSLVTGLLALAIAPHCFADGWLFTSFRKNGETGVFFALSRDAKTWTPLKGDAPWIPPQHEGMLMRDPFLAKGPDGVWHLLWTWGWTRKEGGGQLKIGHASSKDLVTWSQQEEIRLFQNEPGARNVWAPEAAYDEKQGQWVIFWATTITGRFPDTEGTGDTGYNHRFYAITTRDWKTFSPPALWFDPGFNCIDATLFREEKRWIMVFKDERKNPLFKRLRLAFADSPMGPWTGVTEPFTLDWVEGPSVARVGPEYWIYFDHYAKPHYYGAVKTKDWKTFEDISPQLNFPDNHRHGTVVALSEAEMRRLEAAASR